MLPSSQKAGEPGMSAKTTKPTFPRDLLEFLGVMISGMRDSVSHFLYGKDTNLKDENLFVYDNQTRMWVLRKPDGRVSSPLDPGQLACVHGPTLDVPPENQLVSSKPFRGVFRASDPGTAATGMDSQQLIHPVYAPSGSLFGRSEPLPNVTPMNSAKQTEIRKSPFNS